ncbi:hypothetical protein [Alkalimarinus coralli]|uniref:hypothetical protein n=1 Tax=Alkalimarinus coralli TaxID=2935863 RepID=UPI00202AEA7C|nr:hypothetical protein [Alkalimarinus coralli]
MFENWNGLFLVVGLGLIVILISEISNYVQEKFLVKQGILKPLDQTTDEDIACLKKRGYPVWAIKRYRQMNKGVSLRKAKEYVESL